MKRIKSESEKRLIVQGTVNGKAACFLIDSGASIGLMDYDQRKDYDLVVGRRYNGAILGVGGDMDNVAVAVNHLGNGNAVFDVEAAVIALGAGNAALDGESGANGLTDGVQNSNEEAGAVFYAGAAPFIGAGVDFGREELVEQPAVACVNHDHAEAAVLCVNSCVDELVDDLLDLFLGHGTAQDLGIKGGAAIAGSKLIETLLQTGCTEMLQLGSGNGAVAGDGIGKFAQTVVVMYAVLHADELISALPGIIIHDDTFAHVDGGGAALCLALPVVYVIKAGGFHGIKVEKACGGRENTVAEISVAQTDGLKQIGVTFNTGHVIHLSSQRTVCAAIVCLKLFVCLYVTVNFP